MNIWRSLALGDGILAAPICEDVKEKFQPAFEKAQRPADFAIFKHQTAETSLHCEITLYFSPAAAQLARNFGAVACAQPARNGLELLAGDPAGWDVLFSGQR